MWENSHNLGNTENLEAQIIFTDTLYIFRESQIYCFLNLYTECIMNFTL